MEQPASPCSRRTKWSCSLDFGFPIPFHCDRALVPEGHVGACWKGGALQETITNPGFPVKLPWITHHEPIQVTSQTDQVRDIPCGTKGGVIINFNRIEVVNRLRKEYVYETLLEYGV
ncbi:Erlin-like protein [Drosera capensis]